MKTQTLFLLATASLAFAQPKAGNLHRRFHKARDVPSPATLTKVVKETSYILNGQQISEAEFRQGIKNGTLMIEEGLPADPKPSETETAVEVESVPQTTSQPPKTTADPVTTTTTTKPSPPPPTTTTTTTQPPPPSSKPPTPNKAVQKDTETTTDDSGSASSSFSSGSSDGNTNIPYDNSLSCSEFPSAYGAVAAPYLGKNGWIGIQNPGSTSGGYGNIADGSDCTEGAFCSYMCPPGYQKSQWPSTQGSTGQSVGGLLCKGGKLTLTNPAYHQLCVPGAAQVTVSVQNKLSQLVSVCRTDYPGSEAETVAQGVSAGETQPLTCPDQSMYKWNGGQTSAQYYVNPAGVDVQDACQWGSPDNDWGNYAPLNIGAGYHDGQAFLSIFPNSPTTDAQLAFKVSIVSGNPNVPLGGSCSYANGAYSGSGAGSNGCTVSVPDGGSAIFVFEDA